MDIQTKNDFLLAGGFQGINPILPINITTKEQGWRTAAWIICMCDLLPSEGDGSASFDDVLKAIENT